MSQEEAIITLLENSSDFKKINPSLNNIKQALELFNCQFCDTVIVAGTNGKGSVVTFLEQMALKYTDFKVARFISPHLNSVCERISIAGQDISEEDLIRVLTKIKSEVNFELSYFEKLALAAFLYFTEQKVDIVFWEVGMGGRWDCANVIADKKRIATVITSIGLDHQKYLGDTVEKIRIEKEAIKRASVPHFDYKDYDFKGNFLDRNFLLAKEVFLKTVLKREIEIDKQSLYANFYKRYPARANYNKDLNIILDSAHNPQAAAELTLYLKENFTKETFEFHLAFLDKDAVAFVGNLDLKSIKKIYLYNVNSPRAQCNIELFETLKKKFPEIKFEIKNKIDIDKKETIQVYTGSIYFCGEVLKEISN